MNKKAIDILLETTERYWLMGKHSQNWAPGQAILNLKPEERKILKTLKSDDVAKLRKHAMYEKAYEVNCGKHGKVVVLSATDACPYCLTDKRRG